jgi:hypothetical protein
MVTGEATAEQATYARPGLCAPRRFGFGPRGARLPARAALR